MTLGPANQQQERGQKLNIKVKNALKGKGHESDIGTRTPAAGMRTETEHQGGEFIN